MVKCVVLLYNLTHRIAINAHVHDLIFIAILLFCSIIKTDLFFFFNAFFYFFLNVQNKEFLPFFVFLLLDTDDANKAKKRLDAFYTF